jgi:phosphoglycolate phosphatase-like HAD superfamily hydrolase
MLEIVCDQVPRGRIRHALFDFDGTVSLIRAGWQEVMVPQMVGWLMETPTHESQAELNEIVMSFVTRLTGKQTIYQMIELAEQVTKRGGQALEPLEYKRLYLAALWERIKDRVAGLKNGTIAPEQLMVPGARAMLEALRTRGVRCYLASGTDEPYVLDEAAALGITGYFAGIYGAQDDYKSFSKKILIQRIIAEQNLSGPEFAGFGDGFVEIEDTKHVGGIAVGVASDEAAPGGLDSWKRTRLIGAGADVIVPDFSQSSELIEYLFAL